MDVRCPQCQTLYEFDESRISSGSATLKCRKCQHMFRLDSNAQPSREDQQRWMVRDPGGEEILYFDAFDTLHRWIVERKVDRTWEISRTGDKWMELGDIGEFLPIFQVVDNVSSLDTGDAPAHADGGASGQASANPRRSSKDTLDQFGSQSRSTSPSGSMPSIDEEETQVTSEQRQRTPSPAKENVRFESGRFGSQSGQEPDSQTGAEPDSDEWTFGDGAGFDDTTTIHEDTPEVDYYSESRSWPVIAGVLVAVLVGGAGYLWFFQRDLLDSWLATGESSTAVAIDDDATTGVQKASGSPAYLAASRTSLLEALSAARTDARASAREMYATAVRKGRSSVSEALASGGQKAKQEAQQPEPRSLVSLLQAGNKALERGDATRARQLYGRIVARDRRNSEGITGLGWALLNQGRTQAAIARFEKALRVNPSYGDAYIGLGQASQNAGDLREALDAYTSYLEKLPGGSQSSIAEYQKKQLEKKLGVD